MSEDRRRVVVGLDVHKSSVRLAAVRDGELVRERTLGYDHEHAADARRMERREIAVLRRLGFANPYR